MRLIVVSIGAWLTMSPLAGPFGLPERYCIFLAAILLGYVTIAQLVKSRFVRRFGE
jgi:Mg2+-importing ATPase